MAVFQREGNLPVERTTLETRRIFIYLKGGVEKFLVGCKQNHSVSFGITASRTTQ
jgi:hypothetical protein